jgi:hypothetical protein
MQGVIYQLSAPPAAAQLAVSLYTLRRHYSGEVCIFAADSCHDVAELLARQFVARVERLNPEPIRHGSYILKPTTCLASPFDRTVFLDADTIVCGGIELLLETSGLFSSPGLTLTPFAKWTTMGKIISGRIQQWMHADDWLAKELAEYAVTPVIFPHAPRQIPYEFEAVNTGVFAFSSADKPMLEQWKTFCNAGKHCSFTDEYAMQLIWIGACLRKFKFAYHVSLMPDDRYNCSVRFGTCKDSAVIWHLHGRAHVRKPEGEALWWPIFDDLWRDNVAGVREWAAKCDHGVALVLKEREAACSA